MEQINPLIVQAQRKLQTRIYETGGPEPPQPHFRNVTGSPDQPITAKRYATLQLKVEPSGDYDPIDLGAHIDPEGHDAYSGMYKYNVYVCLKVALL